MTLPYPDPLRAALYKWFPSIRWKQTDQGNLVSDGNGLYGQLSISYDTNHRLFLTWHTEHTYTYIHHNGSVCLGLALLFATALEQTDNQFTYAELLCLIMFCDECVQPLDHLKGLCVSRLTRRDMVIGGRA